METTAQPAEIVLDNQESSMNNEKIPLSTITTTTTTTTTISKEENDDIYRMMGGRKEEFREDIRKSKTKAILQQKRIRTFKQTVILKCEERCEEYLQMFYVAEREANIEQINIAIENIKEISSDIRSQQFLLGTQIVKDLCELLNAKFSEFQVLQINVCWILSNLSCERSFDLLKYEGLTDTLILNLIRFFESSNIDSLNAAFWCLSNLAGDSKYTKKIFEAQIVRKINSIIESKLFNESILCQISYIFLNLTDQLVLTDEPSIKIILDIVNQLAEVKNDEIVYNLIKTVNNIAKTQANAKLIRGFSTGRFMTLVLTIMEARNFYYLENILEFVGNLINIHNSFAEDLLKNGLRDFLVVSLEVKEESVRTRAAWVIKNLLCCSQSSIDLILKDTQICSKILALIALDTISVKVILLDAIVGALDRANKATFSHLLSLRLLPLIHTVLKDEKNEKLILIALEIISILLRYEKETYIETEQEECAIINEIVSSGLSNLLQELQFHQSDRVYNRTLAIIEEYFDSEDQKPPEE